MNTRQIFVAIGVVSALALAQGLLAQSSLAQQPMHAYDKTFLTNYDQLQPRAGTAGQPGDLVYIAPNAMKRLAAYKAVMVDKPEILFSPDSKIKGMKPDDQKALAEAMRDAISGKLAEGGYSVAQQPGSGVLYLRLGLTDRYRRIGHRRLPPAQPATPGVVNPTRAAASDAVTETYARPGVARLGVATPA